MMHRSAFPRVVVTATLLVGLVLLALVATPGAARAQEPDDPPFSGDIAPDGSSLATADEDIPIEDLVDALRESGCNVISVAITETGGWLVYIPGAPAFVNEDFSSMLSQRAPFVVLCRPEVEGEPTAQDAVDVLERYFADLDAKNYRDAYDAWQDGQNPQSFDEFVEGYEDTAAIQAEVGEPGRIDAGAGQRYIEIPVAIESILEDGTTQWFEGTYVLHHVADIPGATPEQRLWHIYSADVEEVE